MRAGEGVRQPPLVPVSRTGTLPLSFAQQRLWFIDQLEPGSATYNIPSALRLVGILDRTALERAFAELVRRHEALRTTFVAVQGQPVQVIASASGAFPLATVDLTEQPAGTREAEARRLAEAEAQRPFDLAQGPLLRATLVRLAGEDHVLLLTMHHIVSDGWSMGVIVRELTALYGAFVSGQPASLPALPVQYADFAAWQRGWLQDQALEAQLSWWREQLGGAPAALELPTDRPYPAVPSRRGASVPVSLPAALSESLEVLARREGATPFMLLLAGFQTLLARYSGQDDISVGSPIAGRNRSETEGLIGFFVNTLVLRTRVAGALPFRELLARVRETTLGAYAHQDVPFEKLVEELQPARDTRRTPFFQVMFTLQNVPMDTAAGSGQGQGALAIRPLEVEGGTEKFELTLALTRTPSGFEGVFSYATDLFDAATIQRMSEQLRLLLEGIAANPGQRVSELPLLSELDRARVLVSFNDTAVSYPREATVHALFSAQAARTPDAVALDFEGQRMTYRQLEARSNQLARRLREAGVRPGVLAGLSSERSLEMVVAMLATLKAGGGYLPLDTSYPRERLAFMVEDARPAVVLAQRKLTDRLPAGARVLVLEDMLASLDGVSTDAVDSAVGPETPAYVMYTSGSTGRPKGVLIPHRGIVRLVMGATYVHFGPEETFLQLAPISFDASTFELWGALLHGSRLVIYPPQTPSLHELARFISSNAISTLFLTTALYDQMMAQHPESLDGVRQLLAGGEVMPVARVHQRLERGRSLLHVYGPTESTTFATCDEITSASQVGATASIGRPIANTTVYLLDGHLRPVPMGVRGELYLGDDGLALGYLHRPELTAERFVPDPFSSVPGARMYRTGDVARWLPDGRLEFSGRADTQVKLRGFRIEPGEIESALLQHPGVREAVVAVREDVPGDKRLVAYAVPQPGQPLEAKALREHLAARVPEYMVPSAFVTLEALPLSPTGKVDRKALPVPETSASSEDSYVAPSTPTEELLASLWAEVLHVARVGARDDFFELGGHSLLATQVISRIRDTFHVELPLRDLFEAPTLAALAARVDAAVRRGHGLQAPPLVPVPRTGALPLSFAQQRLWFLDQLEPGSSAYNIPSALRLMGVLDLKALERAFTELVRRHESLRTTFVATDGQPTQVIFPPVDFPLGTVDLTELPAGEREAEAHQLAEQELRRPFNLAHGPLLRAMLMRLADTEHVLVLTMHHIVSDGWSMGVLVRELTALYAAYSEGRPSPLPELPVQYADFAAWQRGWLHGDALESQLGWWREQLGGAPAGLELPTDRPHPAVPSRRGASVPVSLAGPVAEALEALARREGVTPFMLLLAGFQTLLARYSGQDDISVGSPIAGRNRSETEGIIGFFVNTLVLRTRMGAEQTFRQLLAKVRETTLGAYAHQDVPFEKLVEELQPSRDLRRTPLFQVMFTLQNVPQASSGQASQSSGANGLSMKGFDAQAQSSKFELTLGLARTPNGYEGGLDYAVDLFEAATVERMAGHLRTLLAAAVAEPDTRLADLPLLSGAEREHLLVKWNDTRMPVEREACLHTLFEAQADRTPDALAVESGNDRLSFRELDRRATQLAWHLRSLGVGPDVPVAMCLERSTLQLVAVLGILKAGGAYVPLDPKYPRSRLDFLVRDVRAPVLVTDSRLRASLGLEAPAVVCLDTDGKHLDAQPTRRPDVAVGLGNLAYVLYTSGSTGTPKGVMIAHRSVANLRAALASTVYAGVNGPLRVSVNAPLSFDASVKQLIQLVDGHALVIIPEEVRTDAEALLALCDRLDVLDISPSLLKLLLRAGLAEKKAGGPSRVLVGGEALDAETWAVLATHPSTRFFNVYGPTECTVDATVALASGAPERPTLGGPLSNVRLYVLDETLRPVPVGVAGELFIGGAGVGRGYWRRPDLTAEKFIPDALSSEPGARLYRTGDRVRWRADGRVEYLGRTDFQVKVRGFRIETGEIESVLRQHPAVADAVVMAREDVPGDVRLVAYAVARANQSVEPEVLSRFARERLPDFMVPSHVMVLDAFKLSANGKVDRKALPVPGRERTTTRALVAPRDALELQLVRLWEEVLGVSPLGIDDDFFTLGGHSLLAVRLMSRVQQQLGRGLPLASLFGGATVERIARLLREEAPARPWSPLVPLNTAGTRPPLFLVHPIGGGVLGYSELAQRLGADQPLYALQAPGVDGGGAPLESIEQLATLYIEALRTVQPSGPYHLGGWSFGGTVAHEMARQLQARGEEVALVALIDSSALPRTVDLSPSAVTAAFARDIALMAGLELPQPEEVLARMAPGALMDLLLEEAREAHILQGVPRERLEALRGVFESHRKALARYVPAPHTVPLTLLNAVDSLPGQGDRGWASLTSGGLALHEVPGNHYTLLRSPHVETLARTLRECLDAVSASNPPSTQESA
nr:non-ribosomal peptide synthetase [Myxococcus sp. RHSTA-1-4]